MRFVSWVNLENLDEEIDKTHKMVVSIGRTAADMVQSANDKLVGARRGDGSAVFGQGADDTCSCQAPSEVDHSPARYKLQT